MKPAKRVGRESRKPRSEDEVAPKTKSRASPSRSPGRRKASPEPRPKPSGRRSPARKSPARRSPGRSPRKSPSRAPKSPKIKALPVEYPAKELRVEMKEEIVLTDYVNRSEAKNGIEPESNSLRSLRERKPRLAEFASVRRSTRAAKDDNFDNLLYLAQHTALPKGNTFEKLQNDLSEDDEIAADLPDSRVLSTPTGKLKNEYADFGGPASAAFNVVIGVLIGVVANIACSEQPCSFTSLPNVSKYAKLESWFTLRSSIAVLGIGSAVTALSLIPFFGQKTVLPGGRHTFVANGLFSLIVVISIAAGIERFYAPISTIIYEDYIQMEITSILLGLLIAIGMLIKGEKLSQEQRNPNANTGSRLYDFCMGREICPVLLKRLPIKVLLIRYTLILLVLVNLTWLYLDIKIENLPALTVNSLLNATTYQQIVKSISLSPTLLLFSIMQIIYALDPLIAESEQVHTFEYMYEGVGLLVCAGYAIYPFFPSLITKRIVDHKIIYSNSLLAATSVIFIIGFYISHTSSSEKNIFRKNPLDPRVSHLQTLPTFQGKKLLISGWWGFVRHPNYLGDILIHIAWGIGAYNGLPLYAILLTVLLLIDRTRRDGKRCSDRYGIAWRRYCQKVPYCLVPRVY